MGNGNERAPLVAPSAGRKAVQRLLDRGRAEIDRAAKVARVQLERRQLTAELDHFWVRLGKTAYRLVEGGEIDHPALKRAMARIAELEREIERLGKTEAGDGGAG